MNKKVKVTSAAAAVLASLVLANANVNNEVKADTKPVNPTAKTTEKAQTPEEAARANVASAQKNVETEQGNVDKAKDDLDQAKKDAEKPDADYKTQSNKVDGLKKTVDQKNDALTDVKNKEKDAQALADEANKSAKVDAAKDAVTKQEDVVKDANAAKKTADQAVTDKQTEIDKLDKAVKTDTQDVNDKTAAKNQADQAVADAENALKGTGITDAKNAVDTYQGNIDNLNKNIEHNQGVLKNNNNALNDNQETLKKVYKKLDQAKSDTQAAKEKLDTDQATLDKKNQDLQKVKELARTAAGFFKSLAEDNSLTNEQREDAKTAYGILMNDGKFQGFDEDGIKLPWYHPEQQLGKDGDATSLTNMQNALNDLDDLVKVRHEYGLKLPRISLSATAIAMMSSDYLLTHDFDHPFNHPENGQFWDDEEDIAFNGDQVPMYMSEKGIIDNEIANHPELKKYDFTDGPLTQKKWEEASQYWENKGLSEDVGHYLSMTNPAQDALGAANSEDEESHTSYGSIDMLQAGLLTEPKTYEHLYPSFTIDQYKDLVNSYVANPDGANFVQTAQAAAKSAQDIVNSDTEDYKHKLNAIQKPLEEQVENFNKAINATRDAIKETNEQLSKYQRELVTQKDNLKQATDRYKTLTASQDEKVKNYKAAVKDQESANKALGTATDTLAQAKKDLAQAQNVDLPKLQKVADQKDKDATQAQTKLDQLKQHVEDLKNATTILADAKQAVDDAQTAYDTAKKNYDDANKILNGDLKTNKDKADAKVVAAQKAYDEAVAKLQAAKDALAKAQQKLQDILDAEYAQSIITSGPTETKKTDKQEPVKTPEAKTDDISTTPKKIRLTHNAFVYNKHGKLIRKGLHIKWIKRDKLVKVLKNAKIVKINGKRYYQIGRNKFVKVANFEITTHAVHFKARLKGNKKVRAYNRSGKFNKHYARPNHTYTFTEKAKINGKTYYKIAGTNNWIPAKKLALKK
ncbi:SLAP domain-containing protein [Lactobacillus crispatus]|uniref:SLAP domain-containing protein n=1 Tax=Lactobacillus crispatus TaxID=47770 RepID=UPI0028E5893A|nr:SLAP domain-containing protein [Lactobacillus crispatus]MDT9604730.1 SLAP domain-containing protein [Lactobacillus crispatus]